MKYIYISRFQEYTQYPFFREDTLYVYTEKYNEFGEIRHINISNKKMHEKEVVIVKPKKFLLDEYHNTKNYIYCVYLNNLSHEILVYNYSGEKIRTIKFQDKGIIYVSGSYLSDDIYIFKSFTVFYDKKIIYRGIIYNNDIF